MNLVAISIKRWVETGGLEVFTQDVSYSAGADLVDVLTACIARIFSNLERGYQDIHISQGRTNTYNVDEFVNEVGVVLKPVDSGTKPRHQVLELYECLDVPEAQSTLLKGLVGIEPAH
jgi:hypothetical protein